MSTTKEKKPKFKSLLAESFTRRYLFAFILIIAYLAITLFTTQGLSLFNGGVTTMTDLEFYLMVASSLILGAGVLVFAFRQFEVKLNRPLLVICLVLFVIDIVAVLIFPSSINGEIYGYYATYSITTNERIRYIFGWLVGDLALYVFVGVVPLLFRSHNAVDFWLWVGIGVGILLLIASFIKENELWKGLLNGSNIEARPSSLTNNPNTFGFAIFWSFNCALILYSKYHRLPVLIIGVIFAFMAIGIQCKTVIACLAIETLLTGVYFPVVCWKKRGKEAISYIVVLAVLIALIALVAFVPIKPFENISKIIKSVAKKLLTLSGGSLTGRTQIWAEVFGNMVHHPTILLFGTGDGVFEWFVYASATDMTKGIAGFPAHNGFLYVWGRFGIVGIIVYLFGLGYLFYDTIHAIKVRKDYWAGCMLIVILGFMAHSMAEDDALLDMRLKGMMFLGIIWWPLFISRKDWLDKKNEQPELKQVPLTSFKNLSVIDVLKTSYTISMPVLVVSVGFAPLYETIFGNCKFNNINSLTGLVLLCFLAPLLVAEIYLLFKGGNKGKAKIILWSSALVVLWGLVFGFVSDTMVYPIALGALLLLLIVFGALGLKPAKIKFGEIVPLVLKVLIALVIVILSHSLKAYLPETITNSSVAALFLVYLSLIVLGAISSPSLNVWNGNIDIIGSKAEAIYEKVVRRQLIRSNNRITSIF